MFNWFILFFTLPAMAQTKGAIDQPIHSLDVDTQVIYGSDHRHDLFEETNPVVVEWARSSVTLINKDRIESFDGSHYIFHTQPYGPSHNMCSSEAFWSQPTVSDCSGFLVAADKVATAGHCISDEQACKKKVFAFDYSLYTPSSDPSHLPKDNVYHCKKLIQRVMTWNGADFAIVQLDRVVNHRKPLPIRKKGYPSAGTPLIAIGNPMGLPTKIANGANIRSVDPEFLNANLDAFKGNSGSAVINADTGVVEGILVRGATDFIFENGCYMSYNCPDDGCRGEDATLTKVLAPYLD